VAAFQVNSVNNMFGNNKMYIIVYVGLLKPLVREKQLSAVFYAVVSSDKVN
jgi:hypothetical protein